jgi:predicted RNA-binding protein with PIN domain
VSEPSPTSTAQVPDELLRSALQFTVTVAAAGRAKRPVEASPAPLRPYLRLKALPGPALAVVRRAVEADDAFRQHVAELAREGTVDAVGMLWLRRPDGWVDQIAPLLPVVPVGKEAKRREAAEAAAERARHDAAAAQKAVDRVRAALAEVAAERDALRADNERLRQQVAALQSGANTRKQGDANLAALRQELADVTEARDTALAQRAAQHDGAIDVDRLRGLLGEAVASLGERRSVARSPIALPGRVHGNAVAEAEFLVRSPDVVVLVDGYNVAMLGWPRLSLEQQREQCIAGAEHLARRWGTEIHVVFDGADVVGAHAAGRRLVRVTFSPEGVIADDVLRAEVRGIDPTRPVVVVTDDKAIVRDIRAMGANHLPSAAFLGLVRR